MATEAKKLRVGVFAIGALVLGVGGLIWLGASRFLEDTVTFVTYFSESVQGLDPGSSVKYRGVPAGRVAEIRIAPDGNLIEVVMDVKPEFVWYLVNDPTLRTQLQLAGITGLRYVEIDRRTGDALQEAPNLTFEPRYQLVESTRSDFKAIQSALGDIYERIMSVDLPGISTDVRAALQSANQLLQDERVAAVLTNLEQTSAAATKVAVNVERMTTGVDLAPAVENATAATAEARDLFANLNGETRQQIGEAAEQFNRLAESTHQLVTGLQLTMDRLDRTVGSLRTLTDQVREQPSLLLFSEPPPQRVMGEVE
jgi:phospholipid/cholesterol/gamma-HCH transport system substrate-binding protein